MRVENVSYQLNWKAFRRGHSVFIPCLNAAAAIEEIKRVTKRLKIDVLTRVVIQDGVQGVRVWRL